LARFSEIRNGVFNNDERPAKWQARQLAWRALGAWSSTAAGRMSSRYIM